MIGSRRESSPKSQKKKEREGTQESGVRSHVAEKKILEVVELCAYWPFIQEKANCISGGVKENLSSSN